VDDAISVHAHAASQALHLDAPTADGAQGHRDRLPDHGLPHEPAAGEPELARARHGQRDQGEEEAQDGQDGRGSHEGDRHPEEWNDEEDEDQQGRRNGGVALHLQDARLLRRGHDDGGFFEDAPQRGQLLPQIRSAQRHRQIGEPLADERPHVLPAPQHVPERFERWE
jgi:hypothetical protein